MSLRHLHVRVQVSLSITSNEVVTTIVEQFENNRQQTIDQLLYDEIVINELIVEESQGVALRKFYRKKRSAILNDYVIYLQEFDFYIETSKDQVSFSQAMENIDYNK